MTTTVLDGDTYIQDGERRRLSGGDTQEVSLPNATEAAFESKGRLTDALSSSDARFHPEGKDYYGRTLGRVTDADGNDFMANEIASGRATPFSDKGYYSADQVHGALNIPEGEQQADQSLWEARNMAMYVRQTSPQLSTARPFKKALARGSLQLNAMFGGFVAAVGESTDVDLIREWGEEGIRKNLADALMYPPEIPDWEDVGSLAKFGTFALEALGEQTPQLLIDLPLVAASFHTGGGSLAARAALGYSLKQKIGRDVVAKLVKAAPSASIYAQSAGETATELYSSGVADYGDTALLAGIPKAAAEQLSLTGIVKTLQRSTGLDAGEITKAFGEVAKRAGVEGSTEGLQTVMDYVASSYHTGEDLFSPERIEDLKTAIAKGAIVGGGISSPSVLPPLYRQARDRIFRSPQTPEPSSQTPEPSSPVPEITEHIITDREPKSDVNAQIKAFSEGRKPGMYLSRANEDSFEALKGAAPDAKIIETEEGLLATTADVDEQAYLEAAPAEREGIKAEALGYSEGKTEAISEKAVVVQTRTSDGDIITQELSSNPDAVVAKQEEQANEEETVEVVAPQDAMHERESKVQAEAERELDEPTSLLSEAELEQAQQAGIVEYGEQITAPTSELPTAYKTAESITSHNWDGEQAEQTKIALEEAYPTLTANPFVKEKRGRFDVYGFDMEPRTFPTEAAGQEYIDETLRHKYKSAVFKMVDTESNDSERPWTIQRGELPKEAGGDVGGSAKAYSDYIHRIIAQGGAAKRNGDHMNYINMLFHGYEGGAKPIALHTPTITQMGLASQPDERSVDRDSGEYYQDGFTTGFTVLLEQGWAMPASKLAEAKLMSVNYRPTKTRENLAMLEQKRAAKGRFAAEQELASEEAFYAEEVEEGGVERKYEDLPRSLRGIAEAEEVSDGDRPQRFGEDTSEPPRYFDETTKEPLHTPPKVPDGAQRISTAEVDRRRAQIEQAQRQADQDAREQEFEAQEDLRRIQSALPPLLSAKSEKIGVNVAAAQKIASRFKAKYKGLSTLEIEVVDTYADAGWPEFEDGRPAHYIRGRNRVQIFASKVPQEYGNYRGADALLAILRHEVFAHFGIDSLPTEQRQELYSDLKKALANDPSIQRYYAENVAPAYGKAISDDTVEEFFARLAEEGTELSLADRTVAAVRNILRKVLMKLGINIGLNLQDARQILATIVNDLAVGTMGGTTRPGHSLRTPLPFTPLRLAEQFTAIRRNSLMREFLGGLKNLVLPMTTGLYQLRQFSADSAYGFEQYWKKMAAYRGQWENEWQNILGMSQEDIGAAYTELLGFGETEDVSGASENAQKLNQFFKQFHTQFISKHMPTVGYVENYVPQIVDLNELAERKNVFVEMLVGRQLAPGDTPLSEEAAAALADSMLENSVLSGVFEENSNNGSNMAPGARAAKERTIRAPDLIADLEEAGFIYSDKREAIDNYISTMTSRGAFEDQFGEYKPLQGWDSRASQLSKARLLMTYARNAGLTEIQNIGGGYTEVVSALQESGYLRVTDVGEYGWYDPKGVLTQYRSDVTADDLPRYDKIINGFMGRFGNYLDPTLRKWQSNVMAVESALTLAFTPLSSFPDFAGPIFRVMQDKGAKVAYAELREGLKSLGTEEAKQFAETVGMLNHRQTQEALKQMWGHNHQSNFAKKLTESIFKYNGQEWLTNQTRVFSTNVGGHYFETLAAQEDDGTLLKYGLDAATVTRWVEGGRNVYTAELQSEHSELAEDAEKVHRALHKFVDESILRPNAGQRPVWANDPRFALFWHLKSFLYAYWSVILQPTYLSIFKQAAGRNWSEASMQAALLGALILPLAAVGWEIRETIQYNLFGEDPPSNRMTGMEYTLEVMQRGGMAGPFQLALDALGQNSVDKAAFRLSGPTFDHLRILWSGDPDKMLARSVPIYSQLYGAH